MTDLEQARSVEAGRFKKVLREVESQQELRLSRIDAEMSRRGMQHSDLRLQAIFEARLERLNQVIHQRIEIRKELVRNYPELGSAAELNRLAEVLHAEVTSLRAECQKSSLIVPPEVFADLRARARDGVDGLKRDMASQIPVKPKLPVLSLGISHGGAGKAEAGPAIQAGANRSVADSVARAAAAAAAALASAAPASVDAVSRKVLEVIGDLKERNGKLAEALRDLATAIEQTTGLGDERTVYLEQVQFLAEQAARTPVLRRISIVKGIFVALHTMLNDRPGLAPALATAGPLLASHFGMKVRLI